MPTHTFSHVCDPNCHTLILGSFPSVKSREQNFYYGHPQNRFWKLMARLFDAPVPVTIEDKTALLLSHHIAVWDVVAECSIQGSSDLSIRDVVPVDIRQIMNQADIHRILTNGATAHKLYRTYLEEQTGIPAIQCPSTSPANAAFSLERLEKAWREALNEIS